MHAQRAPGLPPPTADARIAALCARQHGVITRDQARREGLTRSAETWRLANGRLFELLPGVLSLTPAVTEDGWHAATLLWTDGTLSCESVLYANGVLKSRPPTVHVTVVGGVRRVTEGITVHRTRGWQPGDVTRLRGLRATTVGRALLDVAPTTAHATLRALVHEAQYRKLIDPLSLTAILDAHPGHRGRKRLAAIDPANNAESGLERRLARVLAPIPGTTAQYWLTGLSGARYRADLAFLEQRVFIEATAATRTRACSPSRTTARATTTSRRSGGCRCATPPASYGRRTRCARRWRRR